MSVIHRKEETIAHFVGVGGIGMSGIAEVLLNQGYRVTGSDLAEGESTKRLRTLGAVIVIGHDKQNVYGAHVVVTSSAVKKDNPEVLEARRLKIPIVPRAEMLAEIMRGKTGFAVAGTHGKTTTTSMLATVMTHANLDPTLVIGGKVDSLGGNAKLGQGDYVVAEADESDGSFLQLPATFGTVTNIDNDHLDHYQTIEAIESAFVQFVANSPFYGLTALCGEDSGVRRVLSRLTKPFATYGLSSQWDFYADNIRISADQKSLGSTFDVYSRPERDQPHQLLGTVSLSVPGRHNILNSLSVIILSLRIGIPFKTVTEGLALFSGVKRRFEIRHKDEIKKIWVVDDYAHHPTEIRATLDSARRFWSGRIVAVFQPHRYSRTKSCREGYLRAFLSADEIYITDIYAAGEDPIEGVTAEALVEDLREVSLPAQKIMAIGSIESAAARIQGAIKPGDLVLCMGAGSITKLPGLLAAALSNSTRVS